jgi:hypothetical protein
VCTAAAGESHGATNIRRRALAKAIEKANEQLTQAEIEPIPTTLTPHPLRRTFAALLSAVGEAPPCVMAQLGHATAELTLALYARQMDRRDGEPERLRELVESHACTAKRQEKGRATAEPAAGDATPGEHNGQNSPHMQAVRSI